MSSRASSISRLCSGLAKLRMVAQLALEVNFKIEISLCHLVYYLWPLYVRWPDEVAIQFAVRFALGAMSEAGFRIFEAQFLLVFESLGSKQEDVEKFGSHGSFTTMFGTR